MDSLPDVSLRHLRMIREVAYRRSFTDAAQQLHLSQSALSRAVSDAERRLGGELFTRTTRAVEPTAMGVEFVRIAESVLSHHRRGMREFMLYRDGLAGMVRVAALPSASATILPAAIAALRQEAPNIMIEINDTVARLAVADLISGKVDLAVTVDNLLPEEVTFTPLLQDRFHVVFRPDHAFHGRTRVDWQEFAQETRIGFAPGSSLRALTDVTLAELGLLPDESEPAPAFEPDRSESPRLHSSTSRAPSGNLEAHTVAVIAGLIATGLGVAAAPALVLPLMSFAGLESAELAQPTVDRTLGLAQIRDRPISPAAQRFADTLRVSTARFSAPDQQRTRPANGSPAAGE